MGREFELRKEVVLAATPEQVWEAIATGPGLTAWFMPMDLDPDSAMVTAWEPGKRLRVQTPAAEDGAAQAFEYLIEARDGAGTTLRFVHSGSLGDDGGDAFESMTGAGWDMYLHTLAQYFEHFAGRPATYVETEAPPSSAHAGAWAVLLGALGLSGSVAPGDHVELTPEGPEPVVGVVDYVTPSFLGVRTSDALYRFHGRAAIGMPIAVGHHVYRDDVDAEQAAERWQAWLAGVFA
ncbi:MAG TPA: SRPBCC domain-containing protein [Mycobacteriales bacterium]